ncbi:Gfo/Idh/MocA family protein [Lacunimicrobium album]
MRHHTFSLAFTVLVCISRFCAADDALRIGLIGLDSSHAVAFTKTINSPEFTQAHGNVRVVAAFPGGSPDLQASTSRIEQLTANVKSLDVEIMPSIEALLPKVNAVIINSVDGRIHLSQARPVLEAGIPLFIDKPLAASLDDALEIYRLAEKHHTPIFSSSTLRFCPEVVKATRENPVGNLVGCISYSPCKTDPTHPDLYWYGIHGIETLFTLMGPGCVSVQRTKVDGADVVTGNWKDGRVGTFRGIRDGSLGYGAILFGSKGIQQVAIKPGYDQLVHEIVTFFQTRTPPVSAEQTLEILAFMQAADQSRDHQGKSVALPAFSVTVSQ